MDASPISGLVHGVRGNVGDNGQASVAKLHRPLGLAVDRAETSTSRTAATAASVMVDVTTNIITTTRATAATDTGRQRPGHHRQPQRPVRHRAGRPGNLFIADRNNHRIRRVDATTKIITTVAGDGTPGFRRRRRRRPQRPAQRPRRRLVVDAAATSTSRTRTTIASGAWWAVSPGPSPASGPRASRGRRSGRAGAAELLLHLRRCGQQRLCRRNREPAGSQSCRRPAVPRHADAGPDAHL